MSKIFLHIAYLNYKNVCLTIRTKEIIDAMMLKGGVCVEVWFVIHGRVWNKEMDGTK